MGLATGIGAAGDARRRSAGAFARLAGALAVGTIALTLGGCLYPDDRRADGQASSREAVAAVQAAVDLYQKDTGVLPLVNADESVPRYEKYKVDLAKLQRMDYLGSIPGVAFEKGGKYQFLLLDEESKPVVKLMDIAVHQAVSDVQKKVTAYRQANGNATPAAQALHEGFAAVDYDKLGIGEPRIVSMFSRQPLDLMVSEDGMVYVDYTLDIAEALTKAERPPGADDDLRRLLVDVSYYVPVKAPAYRLVDGEPRPVASAEEQQP